jgi:hypothetical protein
MHPEQNVNNQKYFLANVRACNSVDMYQGIGGSCSPPYTRNQQSSLKSNVNCLI